MRGIKANNNNNLNNNNLNNNLNLNNNNKSKAMLVYSIGTPGMPLPLRQEEDFATSLAASKTDKLKCISEPQVAEAIPN